MAKIDGFDGLCNIEERHILGLVSALSFYAKENLSQVAKKRGWAKGEMLQALAVPLHGITNEYKRAFHFVTPSKKAMTRTGAPASPAIGTYTTTMGLSKDESHDFELTSTATCILNYDLSIPSYALILLSKLGVYNSAKERISNLLTLFCQYAIEHPNEEFSVQDIDKIIATKGDGAYINSRNDIAFNALSISGFISLNENGSFSLNEECLELAQYIAENGESISGPQKGDDDYMGNVNRGILELLTNEMMNIIPLRYKDLLKIKLGNDSSDDIQSPQTSNISSRQVIYYGAPGTGKSHKIKQLIEDNKINESTNVFRTTFHPDSDYSTFVGCYKPIKEERTRTEIINGKVSVVKNPDGTDAKESNITYTFIPQAFLKAYIKAYNSPEESVILVIEEINRGNCAQIFGDLFQLLDRKEDGTSEYPIKADDDVRRFLEEGKDEEGNDILVAKEGIANGELRLPRNLYIWATMNTSDQSLFPIDSAFKRRWKWKYIPIADAKKNYVIDVDGNQYDWWSFLETINLLIEDATHSEDKKLGYFFAKADDNVISVNTFVSKVIFYLWNDVFKDYESNHEAFSDENGNLTFHKFFRPDGEVDTNVVITFLKKLGVDSFEVENPDEQETIGELTNNQRKKDHSRYSVNGFTNLNKALLTRKVLELYIKDHPSDDAATIVSSWSQLGLEKAVQHLLETEEMYNERTKVSKDPNKRGVPFNLENGEKVYLSTQFGIGNIDRFIEAINNANWNIRISKMPDQA